MLKLTADPDEIRGSGVLQWWKGKGAVRVYERENGVVLMERAAGSRSLNELTLHGDDEQALGILYAVIDQLHGHDPTERPETVSLEDWFAPLLQSTSAQEIVQAGKPLAARLLASQHQQVVLHGDIHHGNVLDAGDRGWLAIDPKGLYGERAFDYVNLFRNPPDKEFVRSSDRFRRRLDLVSAIAGLDKRRLAEWIAAFCALSIVWDYQPGGGIAIDLIVGQLALDLLAGFER